MTPFYSVLVVLTFVSSVNWSKVDGLVCKNGGSCIQKGSEECGSCNCASGFEGAECETVLVKVYGSVTFSGTNASTFNQSGFESRISEIFDGYKSSSIRIRNSISVSIVDFTVYLQRPNGLVASTAMEYQNQSATKLGDAKTSQAAYLLSNGTDVLSARVDIDECASELYNCVKNAKCYNTALGYGCNCKSGFSRTNHTFCKEIYCLLTLAPKWPSSAGRNVTYPNGTEAKHSDGDRMPYKTFIEYTCPKRFMLVSDATGEPQTEVIECLGDDQSTHKNSGWSGNGVRCDMTVEFMAAIVAAVISSAIIVLVGGAFIVSKTNEKKAKAKQENDTVTLEMENSF